MNKIIIYSDSSFAERMGFFIEQEGWGEVIAYTNERQFITRDKVGKLPVISYDLLSEYFDKSEFSILLAVGYTRINKIREEIYNKIKRDGYKVATFISKNSVLYSSEIGEGTIILPCTYIGPYVKIGVCNYFAAGVKISHNSNIGDFNFFSTNVVMGGYANIENNCFIGLNSTIKNDIVIGSYSLIGSASNVLKSIPRDETKRGAVYAGNPAKLMEIKKSEEIHI